MLCFFDTETTGKVDFRMPDDHDCQPNIVQLAAILTDNDGKEAARMSAIIRPEGWIIPDEVAAIHGITTERAMSDGVPMRHAFGLFWSMARTAEKIVAHNVEFDSRVLLTTCHRFGWNSRAGEIKLWPLVCTMRLATPVLKIPHAAPRHENDFKWPKLSECVKHFFDRDLEGAHNALVDVEACRDVYFALMEGKAP